MKKNYIVYVKQWDELNQRFVYLDFTPCTCYKAAEILRNWYEELWGDNYIIAIQITYAVTKEAAKTKYNKPF